MPTYRDTKAAGMRKIFAIILDTERTEQWKSDPDFRRALCENISDECPSADAIRLFGPDGTCLADFSPEVYLDGEPTQLIPRVRLTPPPLPAPARAAVLATRRPSYAGAAQ